MEDLNRKAHWDTIYNTKALHELSWYQPKPELSLELILGEQPRKEMHIIDIGGGDSFLADNLLQQGFQHLSILDISQHALTRAKNRLGQNANHINWIVSDILDFKPINPYDIWHDRAAFHFLTKPDEIKQYVALAATHITQNGILIIGTFSKNGPRKCSGIDIKQYDAQELERTFQQDFEMVRTVTSEHPTPFDTIQEFVFCVFKKKA